VARLADEGFRAVMLRFHHDDPRADLAGLARLRDKLDGIKLAGGEDEHGLARFRELLERGCFDVLQPDAIKSATA
jgi:L-alanine-DL-glutamate epimerase-like enolase superfamily enzyme